MPIPKRKYVKKNKTGGGSRNLNVGLIMPEVLRNYNTKQKEILLEKKYKPLLEDAKKIEKENLKEYIDEVALKEKAREKDQQNQSKIDIAQYERDQKRSQFWFNKIGSGFYILGAFIVGAFKYFGNKFIELIKLLFSLFNPIIIFFVTRVPAFFKNIYHIFAGLFHSTFVEALRPTLKVIHDNVWRVCGVVWSFIGNFFTTFKEPLFTKGPFPHILACIVIIILILVFVFGYVIPSANNSNNINSPTSPASDIKDMLGISGATRDNTVPSVAGSSPGTTSEKSAVSMPTYDAEKDKEYFSSENSLKNFNQDPLGFIYKLFSEGPYLLLNLIFPIELQRSCYSSINLAITKIHMVTGQPTNADVFSVTREDTKTIGRSDNVYNIELSLLNGYDNIDSIKDITDITTNNKVYSLGRPKDIYWNLPENNYIKSDYTKIPDSIKNIKDSTTNLSLEDKKHLTIPWKNTGELYIISCDDIYYTNGGSNIYKPNILDDVSGKPLKCTFNATAVNKVTADRNRHLLDENSDLSDFI